MRPPATAGCTDMGSPPGIEIMLDPAMARKVDHGTVEVGWAGHRQTFELGFGELPETFTDVPYLPTGEIEVTVRLADRAGTEVVARTLTATPVLTYPNGHECPPDGVQVLLLVDSDGLVRASRPRLA